MRHTFILAVLLLGSLLAHPAHAQGRGGTVHQGTKSEARAVQANLTRFLFHKEAEQCIKAKFGIGYVAKVSWYDPNQFSVADKKASAPVGAAKKEEKVAVGQKSCFKSKTRMVALVRALGHDVASGVLSFTSGTLVGVGVGVGCIVATAGAGAAACGALGEVTADAVITGVELALPEDKGVFYAGAPVLVELTGTVFNPKATEKTGWTGKR
jgi:hypothetical protein